MKGIISRLDQLVGRKALCLLLIPYFLAWPIHQLIGNFTNVSDKANLAGSAGIFPVLLGVGAAAFAREQQRLRWFCFFIGLSLALLYSWVLYSYDYIGNLLGFIVVFGLIIYINQGIKGKRII